MYSLQLWCLSPSRQTYELRADWKFVPPCPAEPWSRRTCGTVPWMTKQSSDSLRRGSRPREDDEKSLRLAAGFSYEPEHWPTLLNGWTRTNLISSSQRGVAAWRTRRCTQWPEEGTCAVEVCEWWCNQTRAPLQTPPTCVCWTFGSNTYFVRGTTLVGQKID